MPASEFADGFRRVLYDEPDYLYQRSVVDVLLPQAFDIACKCRRILRF